MNNRPLRQSLIKQYLFCPRSYYYQEVVCVPPAFRNAAAVHGTIVHKLFHLIHTENWDLDPRELYPALLEYEELQGDIPIYWKDVKEKQVNIYRKEAVVAGINLGERTGDIGSV